MSDAEGPEIYVIKPSDLGGDEWRAERDRMQLEAQRRYRQHIVDFLSDHGLPAHLADEILSHLFTHRRNDADAQECRCSCHPRLPESDLHDYGFRCTCRLTPDERRAEWEARWTKLDAFWESPEGRELAARDEVELAALNTWLADNPNVEITEHGGMAPEQWRGTVDGRSFYFRERHDEWRIELDLRPSGRFARVWKGGDLDDDANFEMRELDVGDVIARGLTSDDGYGTTPVERVVFIVDTIRTYVRRQSCDVHLAGRTAIEEVLGEPMAWCPACGSRTVTR